MKERTRHEHRFDADNEAQHPTDLDPTMRAKDEDRRVQEQRERAADVQPSAQERANNRSCRVGGCHRRHALTLRCFKELSRNNGARLLRYRSRRALDVWPPQPMTKN